MTQQGIVIGIGQLGVVFSEGLLRQGLRVLPVLRSTPSQNWESEAAELCVLAVGENDLAQVVANLPSHLRSSAVLMQNEMRPLTLRELGLEDATVCIIWFEKKPGKALSEIRPSVVTGPRARSVVALLERVGVRSEVADGHAEVAHQLVLKNLYILGLNLFGLRANERARLRGESDQTQIVAGDLIDDAHFEALTSELIGLEQAALVAANDRSELDSARLRQDLRHAIEADPSHLCAGRSAKARLERVRAFSAQLQHAVPLLDELAREVAHLD